MIWHRWWSRRSDAMSQAWLDEQARRGDRTGVEQSRIQKWPMNKIVNESGWYNSQKLRTRT